MNSFPLITVIIPTYNQARFLPEALESVFQQTYPTIEIIVIDDGSTDQTAQIGYEYREKKSIRWFEQENQGPAAARNHGIRESRGSYICLLDSDDIMDPQRIALQYEEFQKDLSVDIVYTATEVVDSTGKPLRITREQNFPPEDFLAMMLFRNRVLNSSIMAKSHCLKEHPYDLSYHHAEDYELMLRLAHLYHFKYVDIPLTRYRRHTDNLSNLLTKHREAERKILKKYTKQDIQTIIEKTTFLPEEKVLLRGQILFNMEYDEEALECFASLSSGLAFFYQGNCFLRLNRPFQALEAFQKSLIQNPLDPASYNNLGVAHALIGQLDKAKDCFQHAFDLNQDYLDAQFNLQHQSSAWRITWRELRRTLIPYS